MSSAGKFVPRGKYAATIDGEGPPPAPRPATRPPVKESVEPAADQGRAGLWTGGGGARGGGPGQGQHHRDAGFATNSGRSGPDENSGGSNRDGAVAGGGQQKEAFWQSSSRPTGEGHSRFDGLQRGGVQKYQPPGRSGAVGGGADAAGAQPRAGGSGGNAAPARGGGNSFGAAPRSVGGYADPDAEPRPYPEGQAHLLSREWTLHLRKRPDQPGEDSEYAQCLKRIADFATVEGFWASYTHLKHPDDIAVNTEYMLFQKGVRPLWEDPVNMEGGKFIVRLHKGFASDVWEDLLLHVVGAQFDPQDEVVGVVVSVRAKEDVISVWTRTAADTDTVKSLERQIRAMIEQHRIKDFEYRPHQSAVQDTPPQPAAAPAGVSPTAPAVPSGSQWGPPSPQQVGR